ncbi:ACP S-malonyltransferase [Brevibacillus laterosporus]|uniref:[acyl-carrier-protein] S-malonyltransferase n=1 Tax=Brevibacillus laterosporus TaxID=1465 RepID=A0AAP3DJE6_BRELA|nr:ACP S-malonyltransferase [Brevibacillus laterosporus]MCR8982043.1 ACP S-malonyltransferase [Brevibacillus laterosporus]MCZ0809198.1 ACP S-malonyltransferase [Brevibacillus laterosporus]MCZ0827611.1 ACP S-malonyltransferase [Brevibacillus laterosporus]MCZ0851513.1 ACP S-malonyltransferase [Brevibacillus laterosporus]
MNPSIVFMYSGQGSQYYQMGRALFEQNNIFRSYMYELDAKVRELIGVSVRSELYEINKKMTEPFTRTLYTHVSIFMVEYAMTMVLLENGIVPDAVIGVSLGEFAAAVTAGVCSVDTALQSVVKQAQLVESRCEEGGMLAMLHHPSLFSSDPVLYENSELVSIHSENHFIVSGKKEHMALVEQHAKKKGIMCSKLPVTQGFHSSSIDPASDEYVAFLQKQLFLDPKITYISSVYGKPLREWNTDYFWKVIRKPIQFTEGIAFLQEEGNDRIYLDVGPSGTLFTMCKSMSILRKNQIVLPILTPYKTDLQNLDYILRNYAQKSATTVKKENKSMLAFVFPGQGSQKEGMGGDLFDQYPDITSQADSVLGYSIKELCLEDPLGRLQQTEYTQPALYTVNALMYLDTINEIGRKPDILAGHSLGEYNALFAAGAFDFVTGLKLVKKRGELMSQAVGGGMAAVIGIVEDKMKQILLQNQLDRIDIANLNSPKQLVISGLQSDIARAKLVFEAIEGITYIPLRVSGAFHSRHMLEAREQFEIYINSFVLSECTIPVLSNVHARLYQKNDMKMNLIRQITESVRWCETVQVLMGFEGIEVKEIGPGKVLTGLMRKITAEATPIYLPTEAKYEFAIPTISQPMSQQFNRDENRREGVEEIEEKPFVQQPEASVITTVGCKQFMQDYQLQYPYLAGGMYKGIASKELVVKLGKAGMMGFLGTGDLHLSQIEKSIQYIQRELHAGQAYGMNLLHTPDKQEREDQLVDLYIQYGIKAVEVSAYMSITSALIKYRAHGVKKLPDGTVSSTNRIIGKVSRPEMAEQFLRPAPEYLVEKMVRENKITRDQAHMLSTIPMADDLCIVADSGGPTDGVASYVLLPAMILLRDEMMRKYKYPKKVRIGAAGGIGTPEAAAAAFMLGADFILTGSINQCTVEAGTSDTVKDLLQQVQIQDTAYAPAGDRFEIGAKVQVLKRGVFFPARANKLFELYSQYNSLEEINEKDKKLIQVKYFNRSFEEVYEKCKQNASQVEIDKAEKNQKYKMALIFKWYLAHSINVAIDGIPEQQVDYQIYCGPALGAFNRWVRGTSLESWKNRHVDEIGVKLMEETIKILDAKLRSFVMR